MEDVYSRMMAIVMEVDMCMGFLCINSCYTNSIIIIITWYFYERILVTGYSWKDVVNGREMLRMKVIMK